MKKISAVVLLLILLITVSSFPALAAETAEVELPVRIENSGEIPSPEETYIVVLRAIDDAPMPEKSTIEITGEGTTKFPAISYSVPGIYCYTVSQEPGNNERGHYDETVYYVKVTVTNADTGELETTVAVHTDAQMISEKSNITFENFYDAIPTPPKKDSPAKTGDNANTEFMVALLCISGFGLVCIIAGWYRKKSDFYS
ncbi:MAG: Spy0128 family protein [Bariatricus sp.]